jgi:hypothetical protein
LQLVDLDELEAASLAIPWMKFLQSQLHLRSCALLGLTIVWRR